MGHRATKPAWIAQEAVGWSGRLGRRRRCSRCNSRRCICLRRIERIGELRSEKEALEEAIAEVGAEREEAEADELVEQLARIPDLTQALEDAPPEVQRQVFEAFELEILYDKAGRKIEISMPHSLFAPVSVAREGA